MRILGRQGMLALLVAGAAVGSFVFLTQSGTTSSNAEAAGVQFHLDLSTGAVLVPDAGWQIPPNCSPWHELWPDYCKDWHQVAYYDSFPHDGLITPCDNIVLENLTTGERIDFHIDQVLPTYFMTCYRPDQPPTPIVAEPVTTNPGESPICETWHEIWPNYCREFHVASWFDNGNGVLDECDQIDVNEPPYGTVYYHIDRIGVDIIVTPKQTTSTEETSWGWLKSLFDR